MRRIIMQRKRAQPVFVAKGLRMCMSFRNRTQTFYNLTASAERGCAERMSDFLQNSRQIHCLWMILCYPAMSLKFCVPVLHCFTIFFCGG